MNENKHISEADVTTGHFMGGGYAFYRLPDADTYTFISQQGRPDELAALDISDSFEGFVIAPFVIDSENPLIMLRPDYSVNHKVAQAMLQEERHLIYDNDDDKRKIPYIHSFEACHRYLAEGKAGKIVLSRRMALENAGNAPWDPVTFFHKACREYPHSYVSLWWTKRTGCWLIATPETLLKKTADNSWQTMALAGTMKWEEYSSAGKEKAWSQKNREEQQYVATYIEHQLLPFVHHMETSPTYTSQAADLVHLHTDFTFSLKPEVHLGEILQRLHPTPAVCGVPQDVARTAILKHEDSSRRYYAGFSGPINWKKRSQLYVSLRCMEIGTRKAILYAGGGLLIDSREEDEWKETQRKMHTMLRLFCQ